MVFNKERDISGINVIFSLLVGQTIIKSEAPKHIFVGRGPHTTYTPRTHTCTQRTWKRGVLGEEWLTCRGYIIL